MNHPPQSKWWQTFLACGAVLTVSLLLYWPTTSFDQLEWDDQLHLSANPFIQVDSPDRYSHFWKHAYGKMYVPLAYNSWAVLYRVATDAEGVTHSSVFHYASVLAHAINSLLIFLLLKRLRFSIQAAFCGAILFAVHPLQTEAVAWISEWRGLLAAMFSLIAMIVHVSRRDGSRGLRVFCDVSTFLLLAAAMFSKPVAVVTPLLLLVIDWQILHRPLRQSMLALIAPVCASVVILFVQSSLQAPIAAESVALWKRPLIAGDALTFYLWKLICPTGLCADYARTPLWVEQSHWLGLGWIIPVLLAAVVIWKAGRFVKAGSMIFLIALAPVLGLVWFEFQLISTVADRYCYLAMLGPAVILAWVIERYASFALRVVCAVSLIALATASFYQSQHWRNDTTLWQHAHAVNPRSSVALCNIAMQYVQKGNVKSAREAFQQAAEVAPNRSSPWVGLASIARNVGEVDAAEKHYRRAMSAAPYDPAPPTDLASLLASVGRMEEAKSLALQATLIEPYYADAWNNLGAIYFSTQQYADAKTAFSRAISIHPRHPNAYNGLARSLAAMNDPNAMAMMTLAARFNAVDPSPCIWLGKQAIQQTNWPVAEKWLTQAVQRDSRNIDAINDLGQTYAAQRKADQAIAAFEEALKLAPNQPVLIENLESARKLKKLLQPPSTRPQ